MSDKPEIIEILCCVPVHLRRKLLDWCNMCREWLFKDEQPLILTDEDLSSEKVEKYKLRRLINGVPGDILKYAIANFFLKDDMRVDLFRHVSLQDYVSLLDELYLDEWSDGDN